jgi:hypothetical protein
MPLLDELVNHFRREAQRLADTPLAAEVTADLRSLEGLVARRAQLAQAAFQHAEADVADWLRAPTERGRRCRGVRARGRAGRACPGGSRRASACRPQRQPASEAAAPPPTQRSQPRPLSRRRPPLPDSHDRVLQVAALTIALAAIATRRWRHRP